MSATRRFAPLAIATALVAVLSGCVGSSIESSTQRVVTELEQLPGVASGVAVTGEPSFESQGASTIKLDFEPDLEPNQLDVIVRRWAELIPSIPVSARLQGELPAGDRLEIDAGAELDAALGESATWLALSERVQQIALTITGPRDDIETWSAWRVVVDADASGFSAAVESLEPELTQRGRSWTLVSDVDEALTVALDATAGYPSSEVRNAIDELTALAQPTAGPTAIAIEWFPTSTGDRLDVVISIDAPDLANIPSNEVNENLAGTPVAAFAARVLDGSAPPAVSTQISVRVFDLEEFFVIDNDGCAGQPGCTWTVVSG